MLQGWSLNSVQRKWLYIAIVVVIGEHIHVGYEKANDFFQSHLLSF